jgi:hypothetical protein
MNPTLQKTEQIHRLLPSTDPITPAFLPPRIDPSNECSSANRPGPARRGLRLRPSKCPRNQVGNASQRTGPVHTLRCHSYHNQIVKEPQGTAPQYPAMPAASSTGVALVGIRDRPTNPSPVQLPRRTRESVNITIRPKSVKGQTAAPWLRLAPPPPKCGFAPGVLQLYRPPPQRQAIVSRPNPGDLSTCTVGRANHDPGGASAASLR